MSNWTAQETKNVINTIKQKAATDKKFRERVLNNTAEVVKELTGKDIPADFKLNVIETKPGYNETLVLPKFVGETLNEADLDAVSGGGGCKDFCLIN
ncbi:MAG: NHLP leader peptide family RiPP precursor [Candidatus Muiribacteriota bacterium]